MAKKEVLEAAEREEARIEEGRRKKADSETRKMDNLYLAAGIAAILVVAALVAFGPRGQPIAPAEIASTPSVAPSATQPPLETPAPTAAPSAAPTATSAPTVKTEEYPADEAARWVWWKEKADGFAAALRALNVRCVDTSKYNEYFYGCRKSAGGITEYSLSIQHQNSKNLNSTYALPAGKPTEALCGRAAASYATGNNRVIVETCFAGKGLAKFEFPATQDKEARACELAKICPA